MKQILYDMSCPPFVRINNFIDKELLVGNRQGGGPSLVKNMFALNDYLGNLKHFEQFFFKLENGLPEQTPASQRWKILTFFFLFF